MMVTTLTTQEQLDALKWVLYLQRFALDIMMATTRATLKQLNSLIVGLIFMTRYTLT